jgi:anti-sigma regulatory factor (Ser/Thr protein kinase)
MTGMHPGTGGTGPLHAVVLYDSEASLRAAAVPYVRQGLDRGESVVAVVSGSAEQALLSALGDNAGRVQWHGTGVSYRRLGAMFESFREFLATQRAAGAAVRLLTQNDVGGGPDRMAAYLRYEAMSNEVYAPFGYRWACLYDQRTYPDEAVRCICEVHPWRLEPGGRHTRNTEYVEPVDFVARQVPLSQVPDPAEVESELTGLGELVKLRRLLAAWAASRGMDRNDADALLHAVGEVVTNALQHGRPPVRVRAWESGGTACVRVDDHGRGTIPATAGYHRPGTAGDPGVGLWLARQLADVINYRSDQTGTSVELRFPLTVPTQR